MTDESPWAPLDPQPQPPAPPPPQYAAEPAPYPSPYVPSPYEPAPHSFAQPSAPPPWARPASIPPYGAKQGLDPWRVRGWRGGGAAGARVLAWIGIVVALLSTVGLAGWADESAWRKVERAHYLAASGTVRAGDDGAPVFVGTSEGYGAVRVWLGDSIDYDEVYEGNSFTLLFAPGDPNDYVLPTDRAAPAEPAAFTIVVLVLATALLGTAFFLQRGRRADADAIRIVAVEIPPGEPLPPTARIEPRRLGIAVRLGIAAVLVATVVPAALAAAHGIHTSPETVTSPGLVVVGKDAAGRETLSVRFFDVRSDSETTRPLTPAERGRNPALGSGLDVTYLSPDTYIGHGVEMMQYAYAILAALVALALARRALLWPVRLRAAQHATPTPVEVTAWVRIVRKRAWLLVRGPGATRPRHTLAVPLRDDREIPPAITGTVHVQGRLKAGHPVILRAPNGALLAPTGPAKRAVWAELALVPVAPPVPPAAVGWGWAPAPW